MRILRTDGGGENFADERLQALRKMLIYHNLKIYMLHDHKGTLRVIWEDRPSEDQKETLKKAWEFFSEYEVTHSVITFNNI